MDVQCVLLRQVALVALSEAQALHSGAGMERAGVGCSELVSKAITMVSERVAGGQPVSDELLKGLLHWASSLNINIAAIVPEDVISLWAEQQLGVMHLASASDIVCQDTGTSKQRRRQAIVLGILMTSVDTHCYALFCRGGG